MVMPKDGKVRADESGKYKSFTNRVRYRETIHGCSTTSPLFAKFQLEKFEKLVHVPQ
jgi:hypothetical protein